VPKQAADADLSLNHREKLFTAAFTGLTMAISDAKDLKPSEFKKRLLKTCDPVLLGEIANEITDENLNQALLDVFNKQMLELSSKAGELEFKSELAGIEPASPVFTVGPQMYRYQIKSSRWAIRGFAQPTARTKSEIVLRWYSAFDAAVLMAKYANDLMYWGSPAQTTNVRSASIELLRQAVLTTQAAVELFQKSMP
jgi:hypothetical protein